VAPSGRAGVCRRTCMRWSVPSGGLRVSAPLAGRVLGEGPAVLFTHGLGSTHRFWGAGYDSLASHYRMGFPDLAGWGDSWQVPGPYGVQAHLERLRAFREAHLPPGPVVLVGYSFGALLSLAASGQWPDVVGCIAFAAPLFPSAAEARAHFHNLDPLHRWLASGHSTLSHACRLVARRRLTRWMMGSLPGALPPAVMEDVLALSPEGFIGSFQALMDEQDVGPWVRARHVPRRLVQGAYDRYCRPHQVRAALTGLPVEVETVASDHYLLVRQPADCLREVRAFLRRVEGEHCTGSLQAA
jgi:pimeloyl-ACP methyl ester carboxylesterase